MCGFDKHGHPARFRTREVRLRVLRERDGDACGICGERMLFNADELHPANATVDHVVPAGRGGCSCIGRLRLAHRYCNMKRANDPPATKLRLRGCAAHMRKVLTLHDAFQRSARCEVPEEKDVRPDTVSA